MIATLLQLLPSDRRPRAAAYAVLLVTSVTARAVSTVLLVPLIAQLVGATPADALPWLGWFTATTVIGWIVDWLAARLGFQLGFTILEHAQHSIADRLARIRTEWFTAGHTATARQAVAATGPDLVGLVVNLLTPLANALLLPLAIALALFGIDPLLGVAALVATAGLLSALWLSGRLSRAADRAATDANTGLSERLVEFARTQQALRAARRVEPARSAAGAALAAQHGATLRVLLMQVPGQVLFSIASQLALLLLVAATIWSTVEGRLTIGEAVALVVVIVRFLEPITTLSELAPALEPIRGTVRQIRTVLDAPVHQVGQDPTPVTGAPEIELRHVGFARGLPGATATPVLTDISLRLAPGSTTAIVGPSGAGRTTLHSLLAGLLDPTAGRILLDGRSVAEATEDARRDAISLVGQHPYLFDGSIGDNVRVGHPGATDDELATALRLARVDEILDRLPSGLDSRVGEAGSSLSGGERQRVSIARALLKPAGSPVALYERYRVHIGLSTVDLSLATVTYFVAVVTTLLLAGRLSDILGRKPPSLVAVGLGFAGFFALLGVDGLVPLVLGRALQGVACGLASTALASYVVDAAPERPRWLAAAAAAGAPLIGQTIGALGAGVLVQYAPYPFQLSYLVAMALLVVFAVLVVLAPETRPPLPAARRRALASLRPHVAVPAAARPLMPAAALVFAATWSMGAFYQTFGPTAVAEGLGTNNTVIATVVFAAYMAPNAVGGPLTGRFSPVGAQRLGIVAFAVAAIGLVAGFGTGTIWLVLAASLVAGTAHGMAFTGCLRTLLIQVGPEQRSGFLATVYLVAYCGAALPSLVAGQVSRVVSVPSIAAGYAGLAVLAAVATVILTRGVNQTGPAPG